MNLRGDKYWGALMTGVLWTVLAVPCPTLAQTADQDKKKQEEEQETPYSEEEYAAYEAAVNEPDLVKRRHAMIKFMKDNPKSALNPYVVDAYKVLLNSYFSENKHKELAAAAEEYLAYDPNELVSVAMAAEAYRHLGNHQKFVQYGEKVFANMPTGGYAYHLTKSYEELKNEDRYVEWALKTLELMPDSVPANVPINLDLLTQLVRISAEKKQIVKAAGYAQKLLPILEKAQKPESASAQEWKDFVSKESANSWSIIGETHFDREKWRDALGAFQKSLSFVRKNDVAHYRLGMCYWKLGDADSAIESFARAYVLKGAIAKNAYGYLEQLYKHLHNGTTVGMNKVLDQARRDMGLPG